MQKSIFLKLLAFVLVLSAVQSISFRDSVEHNVISKDNQKLIEINNTDEIQKYLDGRNGRPAVILVYTIDAELKVFSRACVVKKINCIPVQSNKTAITDAYNVKYPQAFVIKDKWDNIIRKEADKDIKKNIKAAIDSINNTSQ